jgi:hypothetical protein
MDIKGKKGIKENKVRRIDIDTGWPNPATAIKLNTPLVDDKGTQSDLRIPHHSEPPLPPIPSQNTEGERDNELEPIVTEYRRESPSSTNSATSYTPPAAPIANSTSRRP